MSGFANAFFGGRGTKPLAVVASNVSRTVFGSAAFGTVTSTALPNTTITGGVAPYTQVWTQVSGDTPTISDDELLNPTWSAIVTDGAPNVSGQRVTVTDAVGSTAFYEITVTLTWVQI